MTLAVQLVLRALLEDRSREMYGLQICTAAGLPSGTRTPVGGIPALRVRPAGGPA